MAGGLLHSSSCRRGPSLRFDPRIEWAKMAVTESDAFRDGHLDQEERGFFKRPDEKYLLHQGIHLETLYLK